jgi:hypothetical protein
MATCGAGSITPSKLSVIKHTTAVIACALLHGDENDIPIIQTYILQRLSYLINSITITVTWRKGDG